MKIALYARVSAERQHNENQLLALREFAGKQGWEIAYEYLDEASGKTSDRDDFKRMMADAAKRRFDLLLFYALDRLSREGALKTLQYLSALTHCGVMWRSLNEPFLDSAGPFGEAIIAFLAVLAKQERIRLVERTHAGLERARRQGKVLGRPTVKLDSARIKALRDAGTSWSKISREMGVARDTCKRAQANFDGKQA